MARLEAGDVELHIQPHEISEIIDSALAELRVSLAGRPVEVRLVPNIAPVAVDFDRTRDVLMKLVDNANLYSPKGQPITISAEQAGDLVTTSVADRGPGIDDFEQGMIFDKFYRGKDQRYLVRGTGMGLPIAKAIVTAHRGNISVTSQLGSGSVFSFSLPAARAAEAAAR
jgi:two-component system sensor histidine kinase KdpD